MNSLLVAVILMQSLITLNLAAMDAHYERNRQAYIAQLMRRIREKESEIEQDTHKRDIVEFVTFFASRTVEQPYAAMISMAGIASICFLTERIEKAIEVKDYCTSEMRRLRPINSY